MGDIIVIAMLAVATFFAARSVIKNKGKCSGCSAKNSCSACNNNKNSIEFINKI
ncbi:MAG: FeoB-associated Cys-rich membrane protein [Christensenellaceae bacterium]|nr:FeoB-associated Cys-rich membrane protein [Christensenellaceae bacterium]